MTIHLEENDMMVVRESHAFCQLIPKSIISTINLMENIEILLIIPNYMRMRVPDCNGAGMAERSYLASEVEGGGQEEISSVRGQGSRTEKLPHVRGQGRRPGGDTPRPKPEARGSGREELPHARGQGQRPGGATTRPRSCGCAGTGGPRGAIPR